MARDPIEVELNKLNYLRDGLLSKLCVEVGDSVSSVTLDLAREYHSYLLTAHSDASRAHVYISSPLSCEQYFANVEKSLARLGNQF